MGNHTTVMNHGGDGEVKLACGCMLPVVAGALSPDGQLKLKQWQTQMVPCSRGKIDGTKTIVMRDTGSTMCVVKKSLVKPEQMTGSYELCMLIDGIVKRYYYLLNTHNVQHMGTNIQRTYKTIK